MDEQRPRTSRWPLLAVLAGVIMVVVALLGWSLRPGSTGLPETVGAGTATALARQPAAVPPAPAAVTLAPAAEMPAPAPGRPASSAPTSVPTAASAAPAAPPVRLRIDARDVDGRGIDAPVLAVGVDTAGDMAVPDDVNDLGWYRFGPTSGSASGSIVVVGHVDSATQGEGAFFALRTITPGATITVTTADRRQWRYRVVGRQAYPKAAVPLGALFATSGAPRLTLITCGGRFDAAQRSYTDNIVVTAVPAQPPR